MRSSYCYFSHLKSLYPIKVCNTEYFSKGLSQYKISISQTTLNEVSADSISHVRTSAKMMMVGDNMYLEHDVHSEFRGNRPISKGVGNFFITAGCIGYSIFVGGRRKRN
jgi:hypothetical protein